MDSNRLVGSVIALATLPTSVPMRSALTARSLDMWRKHAPMPNFVVFVKNPRIVRGFVIFPGTATSLPRLLLLRNVTIRARIQIRIRAGTCLWLLTPLILRLPLLHPLIDSAP